VATKAAHYGRRLMVFGLVIAFLYGAVALGGVWKPKLGLDLQGGTMITLTATSANGDKVTPEKLDEARGIIDSRVNASGVAEAEVGVQGSNNIVVEIPGQNRKDLVDTVKQTAQLRFRLVAAEASGLPASSQPSASPSGSSSGSPSGSSSSSPSSSPSKNATAKASTSAKPKGRAISSGLVDADKAKPSKGPSKTPTKTKTKTPSGTPSATPLATPTTTAAPTTTTKGASVNDPLKWQDNPGSAWLKKFQAFNCPTKAKKAAPIVDSPKAPLITCDDNHQKYLLSKPMIEGTQLKSASAAPPNQQELQWTVNLTFNSDARKTFATVTQQIANATSPLTGQQKQFAIVLDGKVISAPTVESSIPNGQAQITGSFTQTSATTLANSLKYGALPLKFTVPVIVEEGPSLAADQLSAGLWAGGIGLLLVLVYCLLYYRGLGLVVLASLVIAAVITYAMVLVLSQSVGFTLTLPGIAGLIVAVGITADSFVVYFERIRDEMRAGKSMRVAVEAGWKRARATCVAADTVSLLAAVVLYIFAIGVVRGFAFTLGVSTVIDLVVFFCFTKPMVSLLATRRFFNSGHRLSGLSADHIGIDRIAGAQRPRAAGGNA
jgi:preprotein translocase subunit SecD